MPAQQQNLYLDQGTSFLAKIHLDAFMSDFILAEKEFYCQASKLYSSATALSTEVLAVIADGENLVELSVDPVITLDLDPGKYVYDLLMVDINTGKVDKILEGLLFILPTITKLEQ